MSNHISAIPNLHSVIGATPGALIVSIKVIKRAASSHTNPANRRCPTLCHPAGQAPSYGPRRGLRDPGMHSEVLGAGSVRIWARSCAVLTGPSRRVVSSQRHASVSPTRKPRVTSR